MISDDEQLKEVLSSLDYNIVNKPVRRNELCLDDRDIRKLAYSSRQYPAAGGFMGNIIYPALSLIRTGTILPGTQGIVWRSMRLDMIVWLTS